MKKIGCAGIIVEDTFCGPMKALPREGELLPLPGMPVKAGGCAANVAIDLAKQGIPVDILGCVGHDASADVLQGRLEKSGVSCRHVSRTPDFPTSKTVILLVEGQDRRYIHVFGANRALAVSHIKREWVESLGVFYLGGLFALPGLDPRELLELLTFCRSRGILTVVDVVMGRAWDGLEALKQLLPAIDYFLPNEDEAEVITGKTEPLDQLRALMGLGAQTVIVTRGKSGAIAARGGEYWQSGVFPASVIDPSGSGDAFSAGILTGLHRGWEMDRTLVYASALGASATRAVGTTDGVFTAAEAEASIRANQLEIKTGRL